MPATDEQPNSERKQTDESLRAERDKADRALGEELAGVDETADAVISLARARADQVLATARAKTDRQAVTTGHASQPPKVAQQRVREDRILEKERAGADETVRAERAQHLAGLSIDRGETDRDLLSERARSDDSLATRDEFLAIVSHDLLNLLNAIGLYAALINEDVSQDDHVALVTKHTRGIQRAGTRMKRMLGDLIDVTSIEAGTLAVTLELSDLGLVVTEAVSSLQPQASAREITLVAEIPQVLSPIAMDPARIHQVLINVISNAIKFTPPKGVVSVHAACAGDGARIDVSDTGIGIPADKLEAIFERFVQVRKNDRRGVGLGLYISRCIVQGHGGRIWAESKLGESTTVSFTLPTRDA